MVDARNATAKDFDDAAQKWADQSWLFLFITILVGYFIGIWWSVIPLIWMIWCIISSIFSTKSADQLRSGTYSIPNPNNGKKD